VTAKSREWRFLQLAVSLAVLFLVLPWSAHHLLFQLFVQLFLLNSLLVTIAEEGHASRLRYYLWGTWLTSVVISVLSWLPGFAVLRYVEFLAFGALLAGCVFGILRFVFRSRRVTVDNIIGAVVAYLLVAVMFAVVDMLLLHIDPKSFRLPDVEGMDVVRSDLLYFSLVTIVTIGYGDIVPVTPIARMVAAFEGVVGQFYVAAVVAMLVARYISQALEEDQK
jgi:voltage-gated potassium channel